MTHQPARIRCADGVKRPTHTPHDYAELVGRAPLDERPTHPLPAALLGYVLGCISGAALVSLFF